MNITTGSGHTFEIERIPFTEVPQLSRTDIDYATTPENFKEFITAIPSLESFSRVISARKQFNTRRDLLVNVIRKQYNKLGKSCPHVNDLLETNTFTVTTAHQPSLFTGPLYFIYKICSTINLARQLNKEYATERFLPVFVLGGEDHDFDEVNHAHIFNRSLQWSNKERGSVGRMSVSSLQPVLEELSEVLGEGPNAETLRNIVRSCFSDLPSYGMAMQKLVIELFAGTELIVMNMDEADLKQLFVDIMEQEITDQPSLDLVTAKQEQLTAMGYKAQAYVREINLFYMIQGMRNRIEQHGDSFAVVDTDITFTREEIQRRLGEHPEEFSPNVILRPLYQELVLPNLAYIGGGGEIAYWLERKTQFEHYGVPFPLLVRRNSVMIINKSASRQRRKLDLTLKHLFADPEKEISGWVASHSENEVDVSDEVRRIADALEDVVDKARQIDPTFARKVEAFKVKTLKDVDHMGKRLVREEKSKFEVTIQQIRKLYDKLFPSGGLQERHDNFIPFYLDYGSELFRLLIDILDPLEVGLIVIEEED